MFTCGTERNSKFAKKSCSFTCTGLKRVAPIIYEKENNDLTLFGADENRLNKNASRRAQKAHERNRLKKTVSLTETQEQPRWFRSTYIRGIYEERVRVQSMYIYRHVHTTKDRPSPNMPHGAQLVFMDDADNPFGSFQRVRILLARTLAFTLVILM